MDNDKYLEWTERVAEAEAYHDRILEKYENYLFNKEGDVKAVENHIRLLSFYANQYLLQSDIKLIHQSSGEVITFLQKYFVEKCLWADKKSMIDYIHAFKLLYNYFSEIEMIPNKDFLILKQKFEEAEEDLVNYKY